jgi:hypothetical protein
MRGSCHTERNFTLVGVGMSYKSIPGHPRWQLAPVEMAWEGKSVSQICAQIKDPARNGGRTLALLHEHLAKDDFVAWGWAPGEGREPAPGNQQQLGELAHSLASTFAWRTLSMTHRAIGTILFASMFCFERRKQSSDGAIP